jgi:hypothetical protein
MVWMGDVPSLSARFRFEPVMVTSAKPDDWANAMGDTPAVNKTMTAWLILDGFNIKRPFNSLINRFENLS